MELFNTSYFIQSCYKAISYENAQSFRSCFRKRYYRILPRKVAQKPPRLYYIQMKVREGIQERRLNIRQNLDEHYYF